MPVKPLILASQRLLVETLGVAARERRDVALAVHLDEAADLRALLVADGAIRADGGGHRAGAAPGEQLGDVADAADVRVAIFLREAEALGEVRANLVPVEHLDGDAPRTNLGREHGSEGALARATETGEPDHETVRHGALPTPSRRPRLSGTLTGGGGAAYENVRGRADS